MLLLAIESRPNDLRSGNRKKNTWCINKTKLGGDATWKVKSLTWRNTGVAAERESEKKKRGDERRLQELVTHQTNCLATDVICYFPTRPPHSPTPTLSLADWRIYGTHWKTGAGSAGAHGGRFEK